MQLLTLFFSIYFHDLCFPILKNGPIFVYFYIFFFFFFIFVILYISIFSHIFPRFMFSNPEKWPNICLHRSCHSSTSYVLRAFVKACWEYLKYILFSINAFLIKFNLIVFKKLLSWDNLIQFGDCVNTSAAQDIIFWTYLERNLELYP